MTGYCPAVYLICYLFCMSYFKHYFICNRQAEVNSELRVNEAESFNEASEVRTDYLQHYLW